MARPWIVTLVRRRPGSPPGARWPRRLRSVRGGGKQRRTGMSPSSHASVTAAARRKPTCSARHARGAWRLRRASGRRRRFGRLGGHLGGLGLLGARPRLFRRLLLLRRPRPLLGRLLFLLGARPGFRRPLLLKLALPLQLPLPLQFALPLELALSLRLERLLLFGALLSQGLDRFRHLLQASRHPNCVLTAVRRHCGHAEYGARAAPSVRASAAPAPAGPPRTAPPSPSTCVPAALRKRGHHPC